MSSPTLQKILKHWRRTFPLKDVGSIELPFDVQAFCEEMDRDAAELEQKQEQLYAVERLALRAGSDRSFDDDIVDCLGDILDGAVSDKRAWLWSKEDSR